MPYYACRPVCVGLRGTCVDVCAYEYCPHAPCILGLSLCPSVCVLTTLVPFPGLSRPLDIM